MSRRLLNLRQHLVSGIACFAALGLGRMEAAQVTWVGGNNSWFDGGSTAFWNPADEPDPTDEALFNTPDIVTLGSDNLVDILTMSGGTVLETDGFRLTVGTQTTLGGSGTILRLAPHTSAGVASLFTQDLDINNNAQVALVGGLLDVNTLLEINSGSLTGRGTVTAGDNDATVETALENSSVIAVTSGVLTLSAIGVDRLDLDGSSETGLLDVDNVSILSGTDIQTLVVDGALADAFSGTLRIGQRDTATFNTNFTMNGADVRLDGGLFTATLNGSAAVTSILSSAFTVTNAAVIDNDMTFTGTANTITINADSTLRLNGLVQISDASAINLTANSSELVIGGNVTISEPTGEFNWDGPGALGSATTTLLGTGSLSLNVAHIDGGANNVYNGTLNMNDNADLAVENSIGQWQINGTLNKNGVGTSTIDGDALDLTGTVNVNGGTLTVNPDVTIFNSTQLTVATGATAILGTTEAFAFTNQINGTLNLGDHSLLRGGTISGSGTFRLSGSSTVMSNTTVNTTTFDWDGNNTNSIHTINDGITFTINSTTFDNDGEVNDRIDLGGNGAQLIVNGSSAWTTGNTMNANAAASGLATIGGTSRMIVRAIMNVDGDTVVSAPVSFQLGSSTNIDSSKLLNLGSATTYDGGTITGPGRFNPGTTNTVTRNTTINPALFDFDAGTWTVQDGVELTVNVGDYDAGGGTNAFDSTITIEGGRLTTIVPDPFFVMDGTANLISTSTNDANWNNHPLEIGNDTGALDADVNVSGPRISRISSATRILSDADVHVASGSTLQFNGLVTFQSANGASHAEFTGQGKLEFAWDVNVRELTTLNMAGGTVDLDGQDSTGNDFDIHAPLVVIASTMAPFGKSNANGGIDRLLVDSVTAGSVGQLNVQLEAPTSAWTLNPEGIVTLSNDSSPASLLLGSDMIVNGTLVVNGDVRTEAELQIGSTGRVNINTPNEPLTLLGNSNTLQGGTINGPGFLAADVVSELRGFGTINADIDFDAAASLRADNGTLTINGEIFDVQQLGPADDDGVLNVVNPWNTNVAFNVVLDGGVIQGGTISHEGMGTFTGRGTVASRVINDAEITANVSGQSLILQTAANNNDWDGVTNAGKLTALAGGTLELRDNADFSFGGTVTASGGGRVLVSGFSLIMNGQSALILNEGRFESQEPITIGGVVHVGVGDDSTIQQNGLEFTTLQASSITTLNGNLRLEGSGLRILAGATFSGPGGLIITPNSHLTALPNANINVLLSNQGHFLPGGSLDVGRVDLRDYQQSGVARLEIDLEGPNLSEFDRLVITGGAQIAGILDLDFGGGFIPSLGQQFDVVAAMGGVTGAFDDVLVPALPEDLRMDVLYFPTLVRLAFRPSGDFNSDLAFDCQDVNALVAEVASGGSSPNFDMNGDGFVNTGDVTVWLAEAGAENLASGNPYLPGDANLDGVVDGSDFNVWNSNKFTLTAAWCGGDFSADGVIDGSDFGIWNSNKFTSSDTDRMVPEPSNVPGVIAIAVLLAGKRKGDGSE